MHIFFNINNKAVFFTGKAANHYLEQNIERPRYYCPKCSRHYKHEHILRRHLELECGVEPKFACSYCHYKSKRKYELSRHIKTRHSIGV